MDRVYCCTTKIYKKKKEKCIFRIIFWIEKRLVGIPEFKLFHLHVPAFLPKFVLSTNKLFARLNFSLSMRIQKRERRRPIVTFPSRRWRRMRKRWRRRWSVRVSLQLLGLALRTHLIIIVVALRMTKASIRRPRRQRVRIEDCVRWGWRGVGTDSGCGCRWWYHTRGVIRSGAELRQIRRGSV